MHKESSYVLALAAHLLKLERYRKDYHGLCGNDDTQVCEAFKCLMQNSHRDIKLNREYSQRYYNNYVRRQMGI